MVGEGLAPPVHPEFHLRRIFARLLLSRRGWRPRQPACISKNGTSKAPSPTKTASNANGGVAPPKRKKEHPDGCSSRFGGTTRNRTGDKGVADLCLTAWLWCRRMKKTKMMSRDKEPYIIFRFIQTALLERITGLEPATSTLARSRSTK